ncbi:HD domain-containing protein [Candidatus Saganbacteria bacterium]|nr:HD domain-containing protein [Candidatus Saganbacteria bacterium]
MLDRLIYRFQQFYFGVFSRYTATDAVFAQNYLSRKELALFNQLPYFEKKHAVVVAQKMLSAAHQYPELNKRLLARLGLLHDIGKIVEKNSLLTKAFMVMIRFLLPPLFNYLADLGKNHPFFRRFYSHKHHGAIGAHLLEKLGESSVVISIISKHDPQAEPLGADDPLELKILQKADSTY